MIWTTKFAASDHDCIYSRAGWGSWGKLVFPLEVHSSHTSCRSLFEWDCENWVGDRDGTHFSFVYVQSDISIM